MLTPESMKVIGSETNETDMDTSALVMETRTKVSICTERYMGKESILGKTARSSTVNGILESNKVTESGKTSMAIPS